MTSKDKDQLDDEFEAFLHGRGGLSRHLQSLPQPEPSAELDAVILAKVEAELVRETVMPAAANDSAMSGAVGVRPSFLGRWRTPLAMAASVLFACLLILRWQTQPDHIGPQVVAEAPQASRQDAPAALASAEPPAAAPLAKPAAEPKKQAETRLADKTNPVADKAKTEASSTLDNAQIAAAPMESETALRKEAEPPMQIAQADTRAYAPKAAPAPAPVAVAPAAPAAATPAPAPAMPPVAGRLEQAPTTSIASGAGIAAHDSSVSQEKAKAWLALIDELLKADLRRDALEEWEKFRKAYPQYPVPEKTEARIKALKK